MNNNPVLYRISQLIGFLLGARVFVALLFTFALYVSTFFLFNQEESLRNFVFDFRVHGIIFCTVLSILAGGIINQFYDREKDQLTKPFRTRLQKFLKQKYFLYAYLTLNLLSLGIAFLISPRVFVFFLVYQFLMWFYSHKLSKLLILNNLTFVTLTVYPFFGMWVYYRTFSSKIFLMAVFLFFILLICDIIKDLLTKNADRIFGYMTIPNYWGAPFSKKVISFIGCILVVISALIISTEGLHTIMNLYFAAGLFVIIISMFLLWKTPKKFSIYALNILRIWLFAGIIAMLFDGIVARF
ncbi:geranylgeranylglycerol-phosphate geranylgeranyltransferase [Kaistella palustris]|uniref:geranylgeranylglycerol-phosphate geranylgeranyltransferase n=1 Tax=Kaistella palustris TaxID=493376 RepID=UPI0003FEA3E3|nr:geranylgeranylglycerol-phosphate geranylgeranyltransferase [Kaistella palustris]